MEIKHTAGPFEIRYPEGFLYTVVDRDGRIVATIDGQHGDLETSEEHEERHMADAKLIAAAPDLLESLQWLVSKIGELEGEISLIGMGKCLEAIKKATE